MKEANSCQVKSVFCNFILHMNNIKKEHISGTDRIFNMRSERSNYQRAMVDDEPMADADSSFASHGLPASSDTARINSNGSISSFHELPASSDTVRINIHGSITPASELSQSLPSKFCPTRVNGSSLTI
jgi:hypothetical protein